MQIKVFQSGKGDCLLLTDSGRQTRILVDGGMPAAYTEHVAPTLGKMRKAGEALDLVYVSHIDQDHIGGVLRLLDDEVAWRVHEHHKRNGNRAHPEPAAPRPPQIHRLWHNGFSDLLKDNAKPIEEALAAMAPILSGAIGEAVREAGRAQGELVTSVGEAIRVSRRVGPKQLGIPLNSIPDASGKAKLLMVRKNQPAISLGGFAITIIGPTSAQLKVLREEWNTFLRSAKGKKQLLQIRQKARDDEGALGATDLGRLLAAMSLQAEAFGDPDSVTTPNLASLMLFVEEGGKTILLTGDARWDQMVEGLEETQLLQPGQSLAVDILKVPHHGSENNVVDTDLLDRVTARHYIFCGDGFRGNPEIDVLDVMVKHRKKAPGAFKFWFNSSAAVLSDGKKAAHMRAVQKAVATHAKASGGRMTFQFLEAGSSFSVS